MNKHLTCYAVGNNEGWEAICVDFDISVQGRNFKEVYDILGEAICTYVEDAMRETPDQQVKLLNRKVPWHVKMQMKFRFLFAWLVSRKKNDSDSAGFTLPCHA